jgi:hypothetical protein
MEEVGDLTFHALAELVLADEAEPAMRCDPAKWAPLLILTFPHEPKIVRMARDFVGDP